MTEVRNRGNDPIDKMLKLLKKQIEKAGLIGEVRKREYYLKPSIRKRMKHDQALRALEKRKRKEEGY